MKRKVCGACKSWAVARPVFPVGVSVGHRQWGHARISGRRRVGQGGIERLPEADGGISCEPVLSLW